MEWVGRGGGGGEKGAPPLHKKKLSHPHPPGEIFNMFFIYMMRIYFYCMTKAIGSDAIKARIGNTTFPFPLALLLYYYNIAYIIFYIIIILHDQSYRLKCDQSENG